MKIEVELTVSPELRSMFEHLLAQLVRIRAADQPLPFAHWPPIPVASAQRDTDTSAGVAPAGARPREGRGAEPVPVPNTAREGTAADSPLPRAVPQAEGEEAATAPRPPAPSKPPAAVAAKEKAPSRWSEARKTALRGLWSILPPVPLREMAEQISRIDPHLPIVEKSQVAPMANYIGLKARVVVNGAGQSAKPTSAAAKPAEMEPVREQEAVPSPDAHPAPDVQPATVVAKVIAPIAAAPTALAKPAIPVAAAPRPSASPVSGRAIVADMATIEHWAAPRGVQCLTPDDLPKVNAKRLQHGLAPFELQRGRR